jgi:hypothetical protein
MNRDRLEQLLHAGDPPQPPADSAADFARTVRVQLGPRPGPSRGAPAPRRRAAFWLPATAGAALLVGAWLWRGSPSAGPANRFPAEQVAAATELARELEVLFPGQWSAVVFESGGPRLVLAEGRAVRGSAPLLVQVCARPEAAGACPVVLTFSGATLEVAGRPVEILLDPAGRAIVSEPGRITTPRTQLL